MKLSEMRQLLLERDLQLTKSLGQNFLHDGNQLRRIVHAAALSPQDRILEIGPGLGPLTELLLTCAGEVLAIEKDARLVRILAERFQSELDVKTAIGKPRLQLVEADALRYLESQKRDWAGWKLVANLPYTVASPILVELAQANSGPDRLVATLQLEVARRLMAQAADPDYGVLTLLVQLEYEPHEWFKIPSGCFFPEPEVESACVVLVRKQPAVLTVDQRRTFIRLVKRSFSQRRKMMFKLLKAEWPVPRLESAFAAAAVSQTIRAEDVSLEQFVTLTRSLHE